jgi:Ca2+-binding RTX toxin-like protein
MHSPTQRNPRIVSAVIETLDQRRLLSAAAIEGGVLNIDGTAKDDRITVTLAKGDATKLDVRVNKETFQFNVADVTGGIHIDGFRGNDRIAVSGDNGPVLLSVTVVAGAGNDRVVTDDGDDDIDLGTGNDRCSGGDGNDSVDGGAGNDIISGEAGDDSIKGESGNDRVFGGDDDDFVEGGSGADKLLGEDGDDDVSGGGGKDKCDGGAGSDDLFGNAGDDVLSGGENDDAMVGGGGKDRCFGGNGKDRFSDDDGDDEHEDEDGGDDVLITFDTLPQPVKDAFNTAFPGATVRKVQAEDVTDTEFQYELKFVFDGKRREVTYDAAGNVVQSEGEDDHDGVTYDQLPAPVRNYYETNFPGANLIKFEVDDEDGGKLVYEFKFYFQSSAYELKLDAQGNVLSSESSGGSGDDD